MAVRVACPACRALSLVNNPNYLVVVNCHACGQQFLADGRDRTDLLGIVPADEPVEFWSDDRENPAELRQRENPDPLVLRFCPMCGELAPESSSDCPACGELFPKESRSRKSAWELNSKEARRFYRQARLLAALWILLAFLIVEQDYWIGGSRLPLPAVISGARMMIPSIPLLTTVFICLAFFAVAGQFWAIAAGGLFNYLALFLMAWRAEVLSLTLLAALIILTHITLHQASSIRFRE